MSEGRPPIKMHRDELAIDTGLVRALLVEQFPTLAGRVVRAVRSAGTVNALFRVGADLCARLPRTPGWGAALVEERSSLAWLAGIDLPLAVPEPVLAGEPSSTFPYPWAIYRWIEGRPLFVAGVAEEPTAAEQLGRFIVALRSLRPTGDRRPGGRGPLAPQDSTVRQALEAAQPEIDVRQALRAWAASLEAPTFVGEPALVHGDLLPPNLLVRRARLAAVIDFGAFGLGDPAVDAIPAWAVFGDRGRATLREVLGLDHGAWARARGHALAQAAMIVPYYRRSNPTFAALAVRTIEQILLDPG